MLTILGRRTSGNVMKPLWVADELSIAYEQVDIGGTFGGNDQPDYLAKNPMGLVPTIIDDGFVLWESNAITRYLCQKYGTGVLYPQDPQARATADTWMDWQLTAISPMMRPVFWGLVRTPPAERDQASIAAGIEQGIKLFGMLDAYLADRRYIAGDTLSMGDIPLGPQVHRWLNIVEQRPAMPHLEAWYARLTERPAFRTHCMIPIE
ncbi:MAG: glutathione S-transferase [Gammaproteobacteria bacterium]|nr:glutathione S-transferase [Gammaproteobacteria bacterium]